MGRTSIVWEQTVPHPCASADVQIFWMQADSDERHPVHNCPHRGNDHVKQPIRDLAAVEDREEGVQRQCQIEHAACQIAGRDGPALRVARAVVDEDAFFSIRHGCSA